MEIRLRTHEEFRADLVTIEIKGTGAEVREHLFTSDDVAHYQSTEAALVADPLRRRIAELERTLAGAIDRESKLEEKVRGYDTDRHTERDRADRERQRASELKDRLSSSEERVKELEDELGHRERAQDRMDQRMKTTGAETARKLAESRDLLAFKNRVLNDKDDELRIVRGRAQKAEADRDLAVKRVVELEADLHRSEQSVRARDNLLGVATRKIEQARDLLGHDQVTQTRDKIVTTSGVYLADVIGQALDTLA